MRKKHLLWGPKERKKKKRKGNVSNDKGIFEEH
jgi:hypothetical protein